MSEWLPLSSESESGTEFGSWCLIALLLCSSSLGTGFSWSGFYRFIYSKLASGSFSARSEPELKPRSSDSSFSASLIGLMGISFTNSV